MSLESGQSLAHYRIDRKLGEGGMGEVWAATDTRLHRPAAIKALPAAVSGDPERLARFTREAQVLASLSHPNIAAIYGLDESAGAQYLAMELVDGEDLSTRIERGPLPIDDAVEIALQIAAALEEAHEKSIVHRDLKPANIKVTPDGKVKVLDFGLAKAIEGDGARSQAPSPTLATVTSPAMTRMGIILGTAAYMSPEQARARPVDRRADIWAFGCVLYEMLAGVRPFEGDTVTDVIAAVVTRAPDWSRLPARVPASLRRLLERCLDKDPRTRLRDIGEARILLADPGPSESLEPPAPVAAPTTGRWWVGVAIAALALGSALGRFALTPVPPPPQTFEFDVTVPGYAVEMGSFALSHDGSRLALVVRDAAGTLQLAVRDMNASTARILPGTEGAAYPFWSPDNREVAFFAGNELKRIALDGAAARPVTTASDPRGGAWAPGDIILIGSGAGPILRVPASGGKPPEPITTLYPGVEDTHCWPALLPDGQRFVFLADAPTDEGHRIYLSSLAGGPATRLRQNVRSQPVLDPGGRLLWGERGQLLAYPFDVKTGTLGEGATLIATQISTLGNQHGLPVSVAVHGMVAFQVGSLESQLVTVDATGRVMKTLGQADRYGNATVSPDGRRAAFEIYTDGPENLMWVQDLERGVRTPVSHRGKFADSSRWSPDGQTVYFDSNAAGTWEAYRIPVTGGGEPERLGLPDEATEVFVIDVSPDGRWLLAGARFPGRQYDLYLRSLTGEARWTPWLSGPPQEDGGAFSPDSKWIAYVSNTSGRPEVYMAPLEGGPSAGRWPISSAGGSEPRFSPDGKTLYYRSPAFEWMAAPVNVTAGRVEAGTPKAFFSIPQLELPFQRNLVDVLPDGTGFLTLQPASTSPRAIRIRTGR
jgi:Tol biopolymer transport system component